MRFLDAKREANGTPGSLDFVERSTVHLGSGSYRWLDVKRFAMTRPLSDVDALSALLKHQRYQDHYATDEAHWIPTGDLHGPYRLSLLGVGSFVQVKPATARQTLRDWAKEYDGEHAEGFADVLQTSAAVLNDEMTILYLLADRDVTGHDWGWVLGDFYEFVVINRGSDQLSLVVASDD